MSTPLTIGVHLFTGWEHTRRVLDGVLQYVGENPQLTIRDFNFRELSPPSEDDVPPWCNQADGIVAGVGRGVHSVAYLRRGGVPVVNTAADLCDDVVSVFTDQAALAKLAAKHFLDLGFRKFAYVGAQMSDGSKIRAREFAATLADHGFRLQVLQSNQIFDGVPGDYRQVTDLEPALVRLLQRAKKPLALLAMSDRYAVTLCRLVQDLGFDIPRDVAVLGADDFDVARLATPPISSIRPAGERIGYEAARLVHRLMQRQRLPRRIVMIPPLELVPRESTIGKHRAGATDIERALDFIQRKACEGIRIEDVANYVHMPLRTFELQFAKVVDHTVGEEIRAVRLGRAKTLLTTTDLPLATVAHQVGFAEASYFCEFFRRWEKTTPSAYRRSNKKQ